MVRRLFGVLLCLFTLSAATSELYNQTDKNTLPMELRFETSYVSVDPLDDSGGLPYRGGFANTSPRVNTVTKLMLSATVRKFRFQLRPAESFERAGHSRLTDQDLFRLEKVFRI
jgi:hypothetical protein